MASPGLSQVTLDFSWRESLSNDLCHSVKSSSPFQLGRVFVRSRWDSQDSGSGEPEEPPLQRGRELLWVLPGLAFPTLISLLVTLLSCRNVSPASPRETPAL